MLAGENRKAFNRVGSLLNHNKTMDNSKCTYDLGTKFVEGCDPCRINNFKTKEIRRIGNYNLIITRIYEYKTCFLGFTQGQFLHAQTLLPKEKQEVEIIRRSKYQRALHEQRSLESEFESEFSRTLRLELGASQDFNFHQEAGGGFNFFGLAKGGAKVSADQSFHFEQNFMAEVVSKTSSRVSSKYDIAIDTKTEIDNQFRSLRTIENPNPCKVVTFFFKQLNKKFKFTLSLVDIKFDIVLAKKLPQIHLEKLNHYTRDLNIKKTFEIEPLVYAKEAVVSSKLNPIANLKLNAANRSKINYDANTEYKAVDDFVEIHPINPLSYKELTEKQLELKLKTTNVSASSIKKVFYLIKELKKHPNYVPGVIYSNEYCLRTDSIITEPRVSECSICDCDGCGCSSNEENQDLTNLQIEKMKVEIELLKKKLDA